MKKLLITSVGFVGALTISSAAFACDMHGAGYGGFGLRHAPWQAYSPTASTMDPALAEEDAEVNYKPMRKIALPKARPSFSSAANKAAEKAKARMAKAELDASLKSDDKPKPAVKKASLDADR